MATSHYSKRSIIDNWWYVYFGWKQKRQGPKDDLFPTFFSGRYRGEVKGHTLDITIQTAVMQYLQSQSTYSIPLIERLVNTTDIADAAPNCTELEMLIATFWKKLIVG